MFQTYVSLSRGGLESGLQRRFKRHGPYEMIPEQWIPSKTHVVSLKGGSAAGRSKRAAHGILGSKGLSMAGSGGRGGEASLGARRAR